MTADAAIADVPTAGAELLRALGSVPGSPPPYCQPVLAALGLPPLTAAEHTAAFVLTAPPHAAIHLGSEGKLGGEGLDRVAGFWRAIGLAPPADADNLGVLLMLYAELAEAGTAARSELTRQRLTHARAALLREHLWSWAPGYLAALSHLAVRRAGHLGRADAACAAPGGQYASRILDDGAARGPAGRAPADPLWRQQGPAARLPGRASTLRHPADPRGPAGSRRSGRARIPNRRAPVHPGSHARPRPHRHT